MPSLPEGSLSMGMAVQAGSPAFTAGWDMALKEAQLIPVLIMQSRRYHPVTAHRCKGFPSYCV